MMLNIFYLTITVQRREISAEKAFHQEQVEKLYEQNKEWQVMVHHLL
ncbi:YrzI family small protein [Neobacillus niacini]|nr:YrzI family small protein [Neobacillus niacini]